MIRSRLKEDLPSIAEVGTNVGSENAGNGPLVCLCVGKRQSISLSVEHDIHKRCHVEVSAFGQTRIHLE